MKYLTRLCCLAAALFLALVQAGAQSDTLRILAIGNSFTQDACEQDLYSFFEAAGRPVIIAYHWKGGATLQQHYEWAVAGEEQSLYRKIADGRKQPSRHIPLSEALADEPWDVVAFQQQSEAAARRETIDPWLGKLVKYVRKRTPRGVRLMYFQTWAYDERSTGHWMTFGHLNKDMYPLLMSVSREFSEKYKLEVIPVGTAVQNSRTSFNMLGVIRRGDHLNITFGRYLAAATWYEAITGQDCRELDPAPATLPNHIRREMARKCAHYACLQPYEVTSMVSGGGAYHSEEAGLPNYDPALIPPYTLPDPLVMNDGTAVTSVEQWESQRREEILELFRSEVYGRSPGRLEGQHYKILDEEENIFAGMGKRMRVAVYFSQDERKFIDLQVFIPYVKEGPVPAFTMMNLLGNAAVCEMESIAYPDERQRSNYDIFGYPPRGMKRTRHPLELILSHGYAFITWFSSDVDPDFDDGYQNGVTPFIYKKGQRFPEPDQWGAISEWAWAYSRIMDWLEEGQDLIDAGRVAVVGHSRMGKTALWTVAQDRRFAMAVSNCSGSTGAALSRRRIGQTIKQICTTFPHWFCLNYLKYMDNEDALPVDQHELIALCAPRPVYVTSGSLDRWADPEGEFLGVVHAMPVYQLYGYQGLPDTEFPGVANPLVGDRLGYDMHNGRHSLQGYDWVQYINFADKFLK